MLVLQSVSAAPGVATSSLRRRAAAVAPLAATTRRTTASSPSIASKAAAAAAAQAPTGKGKSATSSGSLARQLYSAEAEAAVNDQINVEYSVSFTYAAMWSYFSRDDVALPGLATWFNQCSAEERDHAHGLMAYQNLRGGRVLLSALAPPCMEYGNGEDGASDALSALSAALALEKMNYQSLLNLRACAEKANDVHLQGYCDTLLLDQVQSVRKCADYVSQVKRCGAGYGEWAWDRQLLAELSGAAPDTGASAGGAATAA